MNNTCGNYDSSTKEEQKKQLLLLLRVKIPVSLNDGHLVRIANGIGVDGMQLGVRLGLKWKRIQQIWRDYRFSLQDIIGMLCEWRQQQTYYTNQQFVMALALKDQGHRALAEEVFGLQIFKDLPSTASRREHQAHHKYYGHLADIDLLFITTRLIDGKAFCNCLSMNHTELSQIQCDNASSITDANLEMLVRWRDKQRAYENHLEKMREALDLLERGDIYTELDIYYHEMFHCG
ncbi:uncharacterized protein LOC117104661 [Anneissia japonica]|uniref:uncharacterized protein LOC117104661 n=1 Tax=Anneissia japonica TaxID=1529436 RepID=UPI001425B503|nr:uncharacterized protein LOC117104661 [Anneissia japonica]